MTVPPNEEDSSSLESNSEKRSWIERFRHSKLPEVIIVYITVFVDIIGYGLIFAILPFLAQKYGANGYLIGMVYSSYSLCNFAASFVLGRVSDRIGRKPVLLLSLLGTTIGFLILLIPDSMFFLILSRAISGVCGGSVPVAQAYISDITEKQERMTYMGWLGSAISAGIVVGPAIGGLLSRWGFMWPVLFASSLAALNFVMAIFILKETLPSKVQKEQSKNDVEMQDDTASKQGETTKEEEQAPKTNYWELAKIMAGREFAFFYLAIFSSNSASCAIDVVVPFAAGAKFGINSTTIGWFWTTYGLVVLVVQTFLIPKAKKYLGEKKTAVISQFGLAVAVLGIGLAPLLPLEFVAIGLHAFWAGLYGPCLPALLSTRAPQGMQGVMLGALSSVAQFGRILMPLVYGSIMETSLVIPFFVAVVFQMACVSSILLIPTNAYQPLAAGTAEVAPDSPGEVEAQPEEEIGKS